MIFQYQSASANLVSDVDDWLRRKRLQGDPITRLNRDGKGRRDRRGGDGQGRHVAGTPAVLGPVAGTNLQGGGRRDTIMIWVIS